MSLTLGAVEEALFQAIAALAPVAAAGTPGVPAGPAQNAENGAAIRYIGRWVGEPSRNTPITDYFRAAVFKETTQRCPAILLGFEGEVTEAPTNTVRTLSGSTETVGVSTWSILCVVNDARTTRLIMHGTPAGTTPTMGVYDLLALVEPVVVNLRIDGLYRAQPVRFLDSRALLIAPGELYVLQLRVTTRRVLSAAEVTAPNGFLTFGANVNAYPMGLTGDFADNPLSAVTAYPGGAVPPLDYPPLRGLLARFDAAAVNGVDRDGQPLPLPGDGQPVAEWRDRHSGRWTLAQAEADLQPVLEEGAFNGEPAVTFGGLASLAVRVDWLPVLAEERTVVVIGGNYAIDPSLNPTLLSWGTLATLQRWAARLSSGVTAGFTADTGGTGAVQAVGNPAASGFWWTSFTYTGTAVTVLAKNGASTTTATLALDLNTVGDTLTMGAALVGSIAEVLIYRCVLDSDEVTALDSYVQGRYAGGGGGGGGDYAPGPGWIAAYSSRAASGLDGFGVPNPQPSNGDMTTWYALNGGTNLQGGMLTPLTFYDDMGGPTPRVDVTNGRHAATFIPALPTTGPRTVILVGNGWTAPANQTYVRWGTPFPGDPDGSGFALGVDSAGDFAWLGGGTVAGSFGPGTNVGTWGGTVAMLIAVYDGTGNVRLSFNGNPFMAPIAAVLTTANQDLEVGNGGGGTSFSALAVFVYDQEASGSDLLNIRAWAQAQYGIA